MRLFQGLVVSLIGVIWMKFSETTIVVGESVWPAVRLQVNDSLFFIITERTVYQVIECGGLYDVNRMVVSRESTVYCGDEDSAMKTVGNLISRLGYR